MVRVIINGANGKMGLLACEAIDKHQDFVLIAKTSREDDLKKTIADTKANIVVDLTRADCVYTNCLDIIESGAHPVIGTSGLAPQQIEHISQLCHEKQLGGIIAPNFSIAAVLMMHFSAIAARYLPHTEIIEMHHPQKFDAPSGTAIKTAQMIDAARQLSKNVDAVQANHARGSVHHNTPIHSLRLPGILARQQVIFGNSGETLSITHDSIDRASFMPGIILCCQTVLTLNHMQYGLERILGLQ